MTGPAVNVAYAAASVGDNVAVAATKSSVLEGTKFYLGKAGSGNVAFKAVAEVEIDGTKYFTWAAADETVNDADAITTDVAVFEVRDVKSYGAKGVSFELWSTGKKVVVKSVDGTAAKATDKLDALSTRFVASYDDAKDLSTLGFTVLYTENIPSVKIDVQAYLATAEQDAAFLQDYNSKGLTFGFEGKNVIGNAFEETLQVVPVVATALDGTNPTTGGFVLAKGTTDDMKAFVAAAA